MGAQMIIGHLLGLTSFYSVCLISTILLVILIWYRLWFHPLYISPIRHLPGPPPASLLTGNLVEVFSGDAADNLQKRTEKYGSAFQYRNFFGSQQLYLSDPKALAHIMLHHASKYPKPTAFRRDLEETAGRGLTFVEGDDHRRQRRILNIPFTQVAVNSQYKDFHEGALKLRRKVDEILSDGKESNHWTVVDVCPLLSRATLDIMGSTGFDYDFQALDNQDNPLVKAMHEMLKPHDPKLEDLLSSIQSNYLPFLPKLRTELFRASKHCFELMAAQCRVLLEERLERGRLGELNDSRDLLSIIVKANLEVVSAKDRLYDDELNGILSTFILAGHETTATSLAWALCHLSKHPHVQKRLREEIKVATGSDRDVRLTPEAITDLPFLDAVVRETLRFSPPIIFTLREASEDDVIPLDTPVVDKRGVQIQSIAIRRGQPISLGLYNVNMSKDIFGPDANFFNPERWMSKATKSESEAERTRGLTAWSSIMTFYGGPRACIGYRYAVLKIKTILACLVNSFEFVERDEAGTPITRRSNLVWGPVVEGEPTGSAQLPLRVRRAT